MLVMTAFELGHPVVLGIPVKTDDAPVHVGEADEADDATPPLMSRA
jgi:hypothetical protein